MERRHLLLLHLLQILFGKNTVINSVGSDFEKSITRFLGPTLNGIFYFLLSNHLFYSLGHHATFASIPWNAAFVGLPSMANKLLPATMVLMHIYSGTVFCSLESALTDLSLRVTHIFLILEGLKVNYV